MTNVNNALYVTDVARTSSGEKACVRYTCHEDFPRKHKLKNLSLSQPHTKHHVHTD